MRKRTDKPVVVKQDENNPIATEVLATAIVRMSDAATKLLNNGLNRRAMTVLIHDACGGGRGAGSVPFWSIEKVLDALVSLKSLYTTPALKKKP